MRSHAGLREREAGTNPRRPGSRRGAVLIVAMVCLGLATIMLGTLLRAATAQSRQGRHETHRLQAAWLAESGVERAAHRLAADAEYKGEEWSVRAADFGGRHAGRVVIRVAPPEGDSPARRVSVEAVFPADSTVPVRSTKQVSISVQQDEEGV